MEPTSQSDTRCDKAGGAFEPHATCTHTPFLLRSEAVHHQHHRAGRRRCPEHRVPEPRPRSAGDGPEHAEQQLRAEGQLERQEVICRRPNGQQQLGTVQSWTQVSEKGGAAALSNSSPTFLGRWVAGCMGAGVQGCTATPLPCVECPSATLHHRTPSLERRSPVRAVLLPCAHPTRSPKSSLSHRSRMMSSFRKHSDCDTCRVASSKQGLAVRQLPLARRLG